METKKKVSLKEVVENPNKWIITNILRGYRGRIRVDARTRSHIADGVNRYSEWCTEQYFNRLRANIGRCKAKEFYS